MMKLYQKKSSSLEDETVLVNLERRHTLKEDTNDDSDNLRKAIRANSLGNFGEGQSSTDIETTTTEKQINFTRRPTVITESELSSSSLYKDRKAKINSDEESFEDPKLTVPHEDHENLEPKILNDPKLRPAIVPNERARKMSSCCWNFIIILVICIACLAVMAGVGGIVYMEYFATYKEKDMDNSSVSVKKDNPTISKEIFQHPSHKRDNYHRNEPKIPENILKDIIKNFSKLGENMDVSRKINKATSQPEDGIYNNNLTDSKNSRVEASNRIKSSFDSEYEDIEMTEHPKTAEHTNVSSNFHGRFNHFNIPISDKSVGVKSNDKNQDPSDSNLNLQSIDKMDKTSDRHVEKVNKQVIGSGSIVTRKSISTAEVRDSSKETFMSKQNFNFDKITSLQDIEIKGKQMNKDISFQNLSEHLFDNFLDHNNSINDNAENHMKNSINDDNEVNSLDHMNSINNNNEDNSLDHMKNSINYSNKDNSLDHMKKLINGNEDNSLDHMKSSINGNHEDSFFNLRKHDTGHDFKDNSFDNIEYSIHHSSKNNSLDTVEHSIDLNDKLLNSHDEYFDNFDFDDSSSEEHSLADDQNQNSNDSAQLVFIRPIVESKAVPIPLAFLRRIGFDIKNPNSHQPMTANDMDIKFSLAEALKYLRSLDTENKLPVSREKTISQKASDQKESKKTKLPIKSEREEYLNLLRKQIFENNS